MEHCANSPALDIIPGPEIDVAQERHKQELVLNWRLLPADAWLTGEDPRLKV
jgi:hypothetical protein